MKLVRYGAPGAESPGLVDDTGALRDLSAHIDDVAGAALLPETLGRLSALDPASLPLVEGEPRLGPCVGQVGKYLAIGLNYADHAAEAGMQLPDEPIVFSKATSCICGPYDDVVIPRGSQQTDWEVELGIVIGRPAKYVSEDSALDHVAGYCLINDVSERDFQLRRSGQWIKGKSADTFGPVGPWLVTPDAVGNPQNLAMWLEVNGKRFQDGSTATMYFGVAQIVSHLSQFMSLQPGDLIATGTPPGVGMGQSPQVFLRPGDVMELSVEGLGTQKQHVVAAP